MNFEYKEPDNRSALEKYCRNITLDAKNNKLDPVIGRDDEIRRIIEILSRKTKNNPVLIGEPGVGKTAVVEGFAQRIVNNDVPESLINKQVLELSLSSLIAGASYQGQFEERINQLVNEIKNRGDVILFIDELHQLVGAGRTGGGAMDAANIFKPMMARGEIKIIGATTLNEYRQYIEKDAALERRLQKIMINEPSKQEAITIMRGLKKRWELYHKVKIHDSALVAAVNLSDRYISDRFLPDKAIDLIDEAAAKVKTEMHSLPTELDQINRQIIHIETEKAALMNETDAKSKERLAKVEEKLKELKTEQKKQKDLWSSQKAELDKINDLKKQLEDNQLKVDRLQSEGEFEKASKILYVTIPSLKKDIEKCEKEQQAKNNNLVRDSVTANEISEVISKQTGIPLEKLMETEKNKLLNLKKELEKRVKGQDEAITLVTNAVLRGRAGINDPSKPIGSFLFMGPTGVGKTELAKSLAYALFDSEKAMIRFNMSEFMEKHTVSKLIGAPPGYVGYEQAGALTEAVRRKPYSVILFDEIEKAHLDVLNILLQILDDGELMDSQGRKVNFKNTLIVMTSNIGANEILNDKKDLALKELKATFKPEFINRIDEIIFFNKLSESTIEKIIIKMLDDLSKRLKEQDYEISFDSSVVNKIKKEGYDPLYGARPIRRYIQKNVENFIANEVINNEIIKNKKYQIEFKINKYVIADRKIKN